MALEEHTGSTLDRRHLILYFAGRPIAQWTDTAGNETWHHYTTDPLGTPIVATDETGTEVWRSTLDPWGNDPGQGTAAEALQSDVFLRLPGQWASASWADAVLGTGGVHYNVYRWHQTLTGLFTRPDPAGQRGDPHPYLYAGANPLLFMDPLGLKGQIGVCCKALASPLSAFRHCYLRRIDDESGEVTTIGMHTSQSVGNYIAASFLFSASEITVNHPFDYRGDPGDCAIGPDPCDDLAACALTALGAYPNPAYYNLTGPNSNTFAGNVARQCSLPMPPIAGTWQTPGWYGAPPAGLGGR